MLYLKFISFTPGFSPVKVTSILSETVLTVSRGRAGKTVGNGFVSMPWSITGLKPGVNETTLEAEGK
jgi:hypothetical protein